MAPKTESRLLAADEEALERAARLLGRGTGFVLAVSAPELRPIALAKLEAGGLEVRPTAIVSSGEEALAKLIEAGEAGEGAKVVSLAFGPSGPEARSAMVALNLHREKLLRGAPVVLWLDDEAMMAALREVAPDAYAFRNVVIVVQGDGGPLPRRMTDEPEAVVQARKLLKRAKTPLQRARASGGLAEQLRGVGRLEEADRVVSKGLDGLRIAKNDDEREARVRLIMARVGIAQQMGSTARLLHFMLQGLAETEPLSLARGVPLRTFLLAVMPGSFLRDRASSIEALDLARRWGVEPYVLSQALRSMSGVLRSRGDLRGARRLLDEAQRLSPLLEPFNVVLLARDRATLAASAGGFFESEEHLREAASIATSAGADGSVLEGSLVDSLLARGELEAAERILSRIEATEMGAYLGRDGRTDLLFARGHVAEALGLLRETLVETGRRRQDGYHLHNCERLATLVEVAHEAGQLTREELAHTIADLDAAEGISLAITGPEPPPWYAITFRALRGRVRALDAALLPEAIALGQQALALARANYSDLVPQSGRELAQRLLTAGEAAEAMALLREIEPEAAARGMLAEVANIRVAQVRGLVQSGAAPEAIDERMGALRTGLAATDSRRLTAETLLDLATDLPPSCVHPDVLGLAEETQVAFFEMPMPAKEARAIEAAGDALLARGRPVEARSRFQIARMRLARFGLGLRIPLLDRKLAALTTAAA